MAKNQNKSSKKHGRNKKRCEMYKLLGRRRSNKVRKLIRHLKKYPNDAQALQAKKKLQNGS